MSSLISLSRKLESQLNYINHDVEPLPILNANELRAMSEVCFQLIVNDLDELLASSPMKVLKKSKTIIRELITFVCDDIKNNERLSFFHYAAICYTLSPSYLKIIEQGKLETLDLSIQTTWDNPNYEVGLIGINFAAGKIYNNSLIKFHEFCDKKDVTIDDVSKVIKKQIRRIHDNESAS